MKGMSKASRLIKIVSALVDNKGGLTQSQLAKMMGVHRSTIHRDLVDLTQLWPVYEDRKLIMIDESFTVSNENKLCSFIVKAMGYRLIEGLTIEDCEGHCAITGERITKGVKTKSIVASTVGEYLDLLPGGIHGYLSVDAAIVYKNTWNWGSRLIFKDENYHPLISASSAKQTDRLSWSQLIRDVYPRKEGFPCVALVATDFKKRVWQRCEIGVLGEHTPVYVYAPDFDAARKIYVDWRRLVEMLGLIERIYASGFSKYQIQYSLLENYRLFESDPEGIIEAEKELRQLRDHPEFIVALIAAQKEV